MSLHLAHFSSFQQIEPGAEIVSMITYKDMFLIATKSNVYVAKDGKISLMEFEMQEIKR